MFNENVTACNECDQLHRIPPLKAGKRFKCVRCDCVLLNVHKHVEPRLLGMAFSSLLMLFFSLTFPFLSFSSSGFEHEVTLYEIVTVLIRQDHLILSIIISLVLFVFPVVYLSAILGLVLSFHNHYFNASLKRNLIRWVVVIQPWLMVDVFLVGILVALVKMNSLADIEFGLSFLAFCAYAVLLLKTVCLVDRRWLWNKVAGPGPNHEINEHLESAKNHALIGCHFCGATLDGSAHHCSRCGHSVHSRRPRSLVSTAAFLMASIIMFIPANFFPIMQTTFLGITESSTIMGGVFLLWSLGSYPVAIVIFLASIVIPITKILSLSWLCWQYYYPTERELLQKIWLYRVTEIVGRWSMIDVFVVAVLTGLVQMGNFISILPGPAVLSFAAVVILTILAAKAFDPRLLWDKNKALTPALLEESE